MDTESHQRKLARCLPSNSYRFQKYMIDERSCRCWTQNLSLCPGYINANDPQTVESNFEHWSYSSWRRERVFLISFFLSLLKKKICSLSIYETIEAISLINRRITDSKRNPTISRIWMMIVQELDQLDFFRMKNLQNGPSIGTNLMRATLLLFFLYACRLGRSSIRSRWSKRSPL